MTQTAYGHDLRHARAEIDDALRGASPVPFWLDDPERPAASAPLRGEVTADLVVVGAGYTGLWTALIAKERHPDRTVIVLEGGRVGWAASGRNGGFVEADLTHGHDNGQLHFADELTQIDRLAGENFAAFEDSLTRYAVDAQWERAGMLTVATEPYQVAWLREEAQRSGVDVLTGERLAGLADSPLYRAGILVREGHAFVHPGRLAWGLARAARERGIEIYENTPATGLSTPTGGGVVIRTPAGEVRAARAALATNAFPSLLPWLRLFTVPISDYALMTEPLSDEQLASIGWTGRHGITDSSREFHYYRKSADNRILFGGYDAVYHRGGRIRPEHDQRPETFRRLADHFLSTFPQLPGIRFTHAWGGVIDMSTKLVAHHGIARGGRVAYSAGYTGLGVAATRFGAETMVDLLDGLDTPRTRLTMARKLPIPIPPEPVAYPLIQAMRSEVARSDRREGKDGPLLWLAGRFGIGFDS